MDNATVTPVIPQEYSISMIPRPAAPTILSSHPKQHPHAFGMISAVLGQLNGTAGRRSDDIIQWAQNIDNATVFPVIPQEHSMSMFPGLAAPTIRTSHPRQYLQVLGGVPIALGQLNGAAGWVSDDVNGSGGFHSTVGIANGAVPHLYCLSIRVHAR